MSVLQWSRVGDLGADSILIKLLLYGHSGAGKTHTASTAPAPCFLLTEPNGLPTIRAANPNALVVQADEANGGMDTIRQFLRAAMSGELAQQTGCKTIVVDSLNEIQRMIRDEIMRSKPQARNPKAERFTLQDWGILTDKMRGLVRAFRDLPFHLIAITHASVETNDDGGDRRVLPSFQGRSLPNEIAGYFSMVGYQYRTREVVGESDDARPVTIRRVMLEGPDAVLCKALPGLDAIEDPNVTDWLAKLAG